MNCYAITVRRWWAVPGALVLLVLLCLAAGASEVPVPSLAGGMVGARLEYFTPVLVVIAVMYCMDRRLRETERTAVIPVWRLDRGAVILTVALAHGAGALVGMDVARNLTLLLALALLVRRAVNEAAAAGAAMALLIGTLVTGRTYEPGGSSTHTWWALPLYPAGSAPAWLITIAVFALALLMTNSRD
ncbi:hypothetical protein [Streptomyces sp. enrichment culture]|uniref:hypothetical protein n=1 Tax=Streptomyces sp. enrichment culture TaxID=1795815 RepID=UPI003F548C60